MKIPVTVIGFGLVVLGRVILGAMRSRYLKQASENVIIDDSREIVLRYEVWYYLYPLLCFSLCVLFAVGIMQDSLRPEAVLTSKIAFLFCLVGGIFLLYGQFRARLKIFAGKLTYTEGDRWEISSNEVDSVTLNGFTFIVKKRSEKVVRIPATFQHSEIILAFLKQAAVNK